MICEPVLRPLPHSRGGGKGAKLAERGPHPRGKLTRGLEPLLPFTAQAAGEGKAGRGKYGTGLFCLCSLKVKGSVQQIKPVCLI